MALPTKECHEVRDAFQFLLIWQEYFQSSYGEIQAISHMSNPDDPPDVVVHFKNRDVAIEITTIDPPHIRQSDALHNKIGQSSGRTEIPLSIKPCNKQEALDMMYVPGYSTWENVDARNQVWFDSISERVAKKLCNPAFREIPPGIILLPGKVYGSLGEDRTIEQAFAAIRVSSREAEDWTLATCHQWNDHHYFSAMDAPGSGFIIKQKTA